MPGRLFLLRLSLALGIELVVVSCVYTYFVSFCLFERKKERARVRLGVKLVYEGKRKQSQKERKEKANKQLGNDDATVRTPYRENSCFSLLHIFIFHHY